MNNIYVFNELSAPMADRISICAESLDDAWDYLQEETRSDRYQMHLVYKYTPIGTMPEMGVLR